MYRYVILDPPLQADCVGCFLPSLLQSYIKGLRKHVNYDKLFKEVGMAAPKSIQTRVGMIEINQVQRSSILFPTPLTPMNLHGVANKAVKYVLYCL